jgi:polyisoprenoid-binding protein YceI
MKHTPLYAIGGCILALLALAGCADPAEKTPDAVVTEPTAPAEAPDTAAAPDAATPEGTVYAFTPSSTIGFVGSKVTGSHEGGFNQFSGTVTVAGEDLTKAVIESTIDMTSVHSDADNLTKHLMSADFFEVETYPEARFVSTAIAKEGEQYTVTGDFTLHGVTKSITFPAHLSLADGKLTAHAEFDINRKDFGIAYPGKPDDLIRDGVVIKLNIEATS